MKDYDWKSICSKAKVQFMQSEAWWYTICNAHIKSNFNKKPVITFSNDWENQSIPITKGHVISNETPINLRIHHEYGFSSIGKFNHYSEKSILDKINRNSKPHLNCIWWIAFWINTEFLPSKWYYIYEKLG